MFFPYHRYPHVLNTEASKDEQAGTESIAKTGSSWSSPASSAVPSILVTMTTTPHPSHLCMRARMCMCVCMCYFAPHTSTHTIIGLRLNPS